MNRDALSRHLYIWIIPLSAALITVFFATYKLSESPAIWYDEGDYIQLAINVALLGKNAIQLSPGHFLSAWSMTTGFPLTYPVALSLKAFGVSVLHARAVMALFLIATIAVAYGFMLDLFGKRTAALSVLLLATLPVLYGDGKNVLGEVPGLFYLIASLWTFLRLERSGYRSLWLAALAAALAGLSAVTKPVYLPLIIALFVAYLIRFKSVKLSWQGYAVGIAAFLVPVAVWLITQFLPGDRIQDLISYYANPYEVAGTDLAHLMLANAKRFFTESSAIYMAGMFGAWIIAVVIRLRRKADITLIEWAAFIFSALILIAYLRTPGWYRYFFPALVPSVLFFPYSLRLIAEEAGMYLKTRSLIPLAAAVVILLSAFQTYQLAASSWVASYYGSNRTAVLEEYFSALPEGESVFLYNVPETAVFIHDHPYYQYLDPHPEQQWGADNLALIAKKVPDLIIVNGGTYDADPSPFPGYGIRDRVSHYYILSHQ